MDIYKKINLSFNDYKVPKTPCTPESRVPATAAAVFVRQTPRVQDGRTYTSTKLRLPGWALSPTTLEPVCGVFQLRFGSKALNIWTTVVEIREPQADTTAAPDRVGEPPFTPSDPTPRYSQVARNHAAVPVCEVCSGRTEERTIEDESGLLEAEGGSRSWSSSGTLSVWIKSPWRGPHPDLDEDLNPGPEQASPEL